MVEILLCEMDDNRCKQRKERNVRRYEYHNAGPNAVLHTDGCDKHKSYGVPIHGCMDG